MSDPFAHLRKARAGGAEAPIPPPLPTDPAARARIAARERLVAKLKLLKHQITSLHDADGDDDIWRVLCEGPKQREIYVGNLCAGQVKPEHLETLFNTSLSTAFAEEAARGQVPVQHINMHSEGKYAFVELTSPAMATASLHLNGVELMGQPLSIGRPSGWVDPDRAMKEIRRAEEDIALHDKGVDVEAYRREEAEKEAAAAAAAAAAVEVEAAAQAEGTEGPTPTTAAGTGTGADEVPPGNSAGAQEITDHTGHPATRYIVVDHMVSQADLLDDESYEDLLLDLKEEASATMQSKGCGEGVHVVRMVVPRPGKEEVANFFGVGPYGKAFLEVSDVGGAVAAREGIHGRSFDGRTLAVAFCDEGLFEQAVRA